MVEGEGRVSGRCGGGIMHIYLSYQCVSSVWTVCEKSMFFLAIVMICVDNCVIA